jgi:hypothetical protein
MKPGHIFALTAFLGFAFARHAAGATFCISDVSQLGPALVTAHSNGEDDTIYLEVGTFVTTTELSYFAPPAETHRLSIIGGLAPGCQSGYASSGNTVLDGQNTHRILSISAYGEVDIGRITFQHGNPAQYFGGALSLTNTNADSYLFSDIFIANKTAVGNGGGALYLASAIGDEMYVWSSLFIANSSSAGAIYVGGNNNTYLTGNTIIANSLINDSGLSGGVDIASSGSIWLSNNILWNNENADVYDQVGHARYTNNDIDVRQGFAPLSVANELSVDPKFNGFLSTVPAPDSPMVNAGTDTPPGGIGGCCDARGVDRTQGRHVDIGAYETDVLFRDVLGG